MRAFRHARLGVAVALIGLLACGCSRSGAIAEPRGQSPVEGDANAANDTVATLCVACHGAEGVSPVPLFPNLAGQKREYLYQQLVRFKRGVLSDTPMAAISDRLDDVQMRNLASYYSGLPASAPAASITDPVAFERGGAMFRDGDPANGTPACQSCHGARGQGIDGNDAAFLATPRLRHQKAEYLVGKLADYRSHKLGDTDNGLIMQAVADRLDQSMIAALAAWIASAP